jgi:hypothetical protein
VRHEMLWTVLWFESQKRVGPKESVTLSHTSTWTPPGVLVKS